MSAWYVNKIKIHFGIILSERAELGTIETTYFYEVANEHIIIVYNKPLYMSYISIQYYIVSK